MTLKESYCKDCVDLCGDSVDCRVFVFDGVEYEQPPASMIVDGILRILYGKQQQDVQEPYALPENLKKYFAGKEKIMKTISIYEPAMCCETGLCGVSIDPELLRISTVASNLKKHGITINRYNLNNFPQEFIDNSEINKLINGDGGVDNLPATVVDGKIVKTKKYPFNSELMVWLGIPESYFGEEVKHPCGCSCGCC